MKTKAIDKLIDACRKLKSAHDERWERTKNLRELATRARKEGKNLSHLIDESPTVFDVGDICNEIIDCLEEIDKEKEVK